MIIFLLFFTCGEDCNPNWQDVIYEIVIQTTCVNNIGLSNGGKNVGTVSAYILEDKLSLADLGRKLDDPGETSLILFLSNFKTTHLKLHGGSD